MIVVVMGLLDVIVVVKGLLDVMVVLRLVLDEQSDMEFSVISLTILPEPAHFTLSGSAIFWCPFMKCVPLVQNTIHITWIPLPTSLSLSLPQPPCAQTMKRRVVDAAQLVVI